MNLAKKNMVILLQLNQETWWFNGDLAKKHGDLMGI